MKLQEVAQQVQMTKRAIKYYEEKGLLQVEKDENGYRRYTEDHIAVLQQIQVYRKLGMELSAIQRILHDPQVEQEELQRLKNRCRDIWSSNLHSWRQCNKCWQAQRITRYCRSSLIIKQLRQLFRK